MKTLFIVSGVLFFLVVRSFGQEKFEPQRIQMPTASNTPAGSQMAVTNPYVVFDQKGLPHFRMSVVKTPETKEKDQIVAQALTLLTNKDYDGLEALASKYRASKEHYADGVWKLLIYYNAIELSDSVPETEWQTRRNQIDEWIKAKSDSVTAQVAMARFLRNYAWKLRGTGTVETVKEESWQPFFDRLHEALLSLQNAKACKDKCPVYWSTLEGVALGLQWNRNQFNAVFLEGFREFPGFDYLYKKRMVYLLPRWFGEAGEWEEDLKKSADLIGGDAGDMLYAQVAWDFHLHCSSSNAFEESKLSWQRVDKGFEVILKEFPDSLAAKNERFHLAVLARDIKKAQAYFIQTKGQVDLSVWDSINDAARLAQYAFTH
jgi:hypothetical protein